MKKDNDYIIVTCNVAKSEIVSRVRALPGVCLTSTGMRCRSVRL